MVHIIHKSHAPLDLHPITQQLYLHCKPTWQLLLGWCLHIIWLKQMHFFFGVLDRFWCTNLGKRVQHQSFFIDTKCRLSHPFMKWLLVVVVVAFYAGVSVDFPWSYLHFCIDCYLLICREMEYDQTVDVSFLQLSSLLHISKEEWKCTEYFRSLIVLGIAYRDCLRHTAVNICMSTDWKILMHVMRNHAMNMAFSRIKFKLVQSFKLHNEWNRQPNQFISFAWNWGEKEYDKYYCKMFQQEQRCFSLDIFWESQR